MTIMMKLCCSGVYEKIKIVSLLGSVNKEHRRITTRYDKLDSTFMAFVSCTFISQVIC